MMSSRFRILGSAVLLVTLLMATGCPGGSNRPGRVRRAPGPAGPTVWDRLSDPKPAVRLAAIGELKPGPRAAAALIERLADTDAAIKAQAAKLLAEWGSVSLGLLVEQLGKDQAAADRAATVLKDIGFGSVQALITGLGSRNPQLARRAEAVLVGLGTAAEYELPKAMTHPSVQVRRVVVRLLGSQKGSAGIKALVKALRDPDASVRKIATDGLARVNPEAAAPLLAAALKHPKVAPAQKAGIILAIRNQPGPEMALAVARHFALAPDTATRHDWLVALTRRPNNEGFQAIAQVFKDNDPSVVAALILALQYAVQSLERIQSASAALGDRPLEKWAVTELRRLGAGLRFQHVVQALQSALSSKSTMGAGAAVVLRALGQKASLAYVQDQIIESYRQDLKNLDPVTDVDRRIIALAQMGELLWNRSCKIAGLYGTCALVRYPKLPGQARPARTLVMLQRDPALVKQALGYLQQAWAAWADGKAATQIPADEHQVSRLYHLRHNVAWTRFLMAEAVAEAELAAPQPAPLLEGPAGSEKATASARKVAEWLAKRQARLEKIRAEYRAVVEQTRVTVEGKRQASRYWSTAASARMGFFTELFAAEALAVRTDKVAPAPALQAALQDLVAAHRAPLFAQAAAYYRGCLGGARSQVGHGEWALLCEGRLQAVDPTGWAASRRTVPPADALAARASAGTLDVATWNRALAGPRTAALRCLAAPGGPKVRQATVTLRLGQDGALVAPPVVKGLEKEPPVSTCVVNALRTLALPAHGEPPQTVTLPLLPLPAASAGLPAQILATFADGK